MNGNLSFLQKKLAKPGDEVSFDVLIHLQHLKESRIIQGTVKKVLTNSVIVDISKHPYSAFYDFETTVVSHSKYKVVS